MDVVTRMNAEYHWTQAKAIATRTAMVCLVAGTLFYAQHHAQSVYACTFWEMCNTFLDFLYGGN